MGNQYAKSLYNIIPQKHEEKINGSRSNNQLSPLS